jgi:hypothetical protein
MIVNGTKVEGTPKSVKVTVKGKELELTMAYIAEADVVEHTFNWCETPSADIVIESRKSGNRVVTSIIQAKKDDKGKVTKKVIFDSLTAQSAFSVLETVFGWSKSKSDTVYKKSNPGRKESKQGAASKIVITEAGVF